MVDNLTDFSSTTEDDEDENRAGGGAVLPASSSSSSAAALAAEDALDAEMVNLATSLASDLADLVHSMNLATLGEDR